MITAVLDARCGVSLAGADVYLNIAGGLKVNEPAADLACAAALISSLTQTPVPPDTVVFGEIGLAGEVRQVGQTEARLKEAAKLGFSKAFLPRRRRKQGGGDAPLELVEIDQLAELVTRLDGESTLRRKRA
jgi:DNA repair protein RadA/Sms